MNAIITVEKFLQSVKEQTSLRDLHIGGLSEVIFENSYISVVATSSQPYRDMDILAVTFRVSNNDTHLVRFTGRHLVASNTTIWNDPQEIFKF